MYSKFSINQGVNYQKKISGRVNLVQVKDHGMDIAQIFDLSLIQL